MIRCGVCSFVIELIGGNLFSTWCLLNVDRVQPLTAVIDEHRNTIVWSFLGVSCDFIFLKHGWNLSRCLSISR